MDKLPRFGIRVDGSMTAAECVELAKAADKAGFASIWFAENAFARGILPAAAACAVSTSKIRINAGVFNPYSRHPTMMAMEIGALDELSGGRAGISVGTGILSAVEKMGISSAKPLHGVRDTIHILRALLRGEEIDYSGNTFSARKIRLDFRPRSDIQIFLAGRGNLMVKLSGEAADGVIVSNMVSVGFAGGIAGAMNASRAAAGRAGPGEVVQYMPCSVNRNAQQAMSAAKMAVGEMLPRFWALGKKLESAKQAMLVGTGISEQEFTEVADRLRAGGHPADVMEDRYARAFSLVGSPEECVQSAREFGAAGVTEIALTFTGPDAIDEIAALGNAIAGEKAL